MRRLTLIIAAAGILAQPVAGETRDILAIGDSVLEWQSFRGGAVPQVVARRLGRSVENNAASGAKMYLTGDEANPRSVIPAQYQPGPWNWVIVNGGANDLLTKCGCRRCDAVLDRLVTRDGARGVLPDLVRRIRADAAQVLLLGYYNGNARPNLFSRCSIVVQELNNRVQRLANRQRGVHMLRMAPAIDPQNRRHFALDGFHPSRLGARRIGSLVADTIKQIERGN